MGSSECSLSEGGGSLGQRGSDSKTVVLSPEWFGPHWAFFYRYFCGALERVGRVNATGI